MRDLYARVILWLIRPALDLHKQRTGDRAVIDAVLKDLRNNGRFGQAIRTLTDASGRCPVSRPK